MNNVIIGKDADASANNASNQIVIGQGATGTGDNEIALGNTSITAIKCQVSSITAYSDKRIKRDIKENTLGLDFITRLNPVKYKKINPADYPEEILENRFKKDEPDERPEDDENEYDGLIAQEVEQTLNDIGKTWSGHSINESDGKQGVQYGALTVPLINAVKELSNENNELKEDITFLKSENELLKNQIANIIKRLNNLES